MKIGIIGAGSIGLLSAASLNKSFEVKIYTRTPEQAFEINKFGIEVQKGVEREVSFVKAFPITEWSGFEDLSIITVKQYQLPELILNVNQLPETPKSLLFLQNGMGHLKLLDQIRAQNIFVGSIEHGALRDNSYTVTQNGEGVTNVAVYKGNSELLRLLIKTAPEDFPLVMKENYYEMLLNKLMVNAVVNPLTAILRVKNGELIQNHFFNKALTNLFKEISFILNIEKPQPYFEQIINICKNTANNRSSMLKDIEAGRPTEIDAILGYLLEEAKKQNKKAPQIENLYYLIKGNELEKGEC
ncbi:2-dehydropantoate 2-reductase [Paenibacillus sp. BSR1-1]|uniref:2-dehydropantoate 2-reductase n=1 Tax=Paenibacillus sp. BSR1-1 TaxID=3020845 RepID=UPI0025B15F8B|nr:2-dehydropantoate 2-reductase [Paenibacillus sp. BSR1-1]MDN3014859.1 2-dehydropantoate 2-reductase [Paenibacillus sp. BSR1-1]